MNRKCYNCKKYCKSIINKEKFYCKKCHFILNSCIFYIDINNNIYFQKNINKILSFLYIDKLELIIYPFINYYININNFNGKYIFNSYYNQKLKGNYYVYYDNINRLYFYNISLF